MGDESVEIEIGHAADLQNLQDLNNQLSADIRDMKGTLCDLTVENKKLNREKRGERDTWQSEEKRLKEIISYKNAEIKKLQSEIKRIEKRHSDLTQQNNRLSTEYRELYERQNRKLSESKVEIEKLKEKILSLETAMKERDEHICEKITAKVETALQNNQEEMMKKLAENKRDSDDKLETLMNFIAGNEMVHKETMAEKDRVYKETMAEKDRMHKEEMFEMFKKFEEKIDSKQTSEQQKSSSVRQPKQSSNETCSENKVQSNYFERKFRQKPNEPLGTNKETTETQRLSWPDSQVLIKRDDDGLTYTHEALERVPNGKILVSNVRNKQSPSSVTQSEQMHYVPEQQQRTRLERNSQHNFPNIRRQRSLNWSTPNAPFKYPQSKKSKR